MFTSMKLQTSTIVLSVAPNARIATALQTSTVQHASLHISYLRLNKNVLFLRLVPRVTIKTKMAIAGLVISTVLSVTEQISSNVLLVKMVSSKLIKDLVVWHLVLEVSMETI